MKKTHIFQSAGWGAVSEVYKVQLKNTEFALKVFRDFHSGYYSVDQEKVKILGTKDFQSLQKQPFVNISHSSNENKTVFSSLEKAFLFTAHEYLFCKKLFGNLVLPTYFISFKLNKDLIATTPMPDARLYEKVSLKYSNESRKKIHEHEINKLMKEERIYRADSSVVESFLKKDFQSPFGGWAKPEPLNISNALLYPWYHVLLGKKDTYIFAAVQEWIDCLSLKSMSSSGITKIQKKQLGQVYKKLVRVFAETGYFLDPDVSLSDKLGYAPHLRKFIIRDSNWLHHKKYSWAGNPKPMFDCIENLIT